GYSQFPQGFDPLLQRGMSAKERRQGAAPEHGFYNAQGRRWCSRETGRAPLESKAILSEKKYANAFVQIAIPNPRVIPFRPPKYWPTSIRKSVSAPSRKVVRITLIVPLIFCYVRTTLNLTYFAETGECPGTAQPVSIRFARRRRVVSPACARTAWRPSARRGPRARDRPAEFYLP